MRAVTPPGDGCVSTVILKGGVSVRLLALQLAWTLEDRGCTLAVDGDDLLVTPSELLTDADRQQIRHWREELKRIVRYGERVA